MSSPTIKYNHVYSVMTYLQAQYSDEDIRRQLGRMGRARRVTEEERRIVTEELDSRIADRGAFRWVECPVWRHRLYQSVSHFGIDADELSTIMKYVLEGEIPPSMKNTALHPSHESFRRAKRFVKETEPEGSSGAG